MATITREKPSAWTSDPWTAPLPMLPQRPAPDGSGLRLQ